jgi:hypothetical protein
LNWLWFSLYAQWIDDSKKYPAGLGQTGVTGKLQLMFLMKKEVTEKIREPLGDYSIIALLNEADTLPLGERRSFIQVHSLGQCFKTTPNIRVFTTFQWSRLNWLRRAC